MPAPKNRGECTPGTRTRYSGNWRSSEFFYGAQERLEVDGLHQVTVEPRRKCPVEIGRLPESCDRNQSQRSPGFDEGSQPRREFIATHFGHSDVDQRNGRVEVLADLECGARLERDFHVVSVIDESSMQGFCRVAIVVNDQ